MYCQLAVSACVQTLLVAVKDKDYYLCQPYFSYHFIVLVRHQLFLKMTEFCEPVG
jgi:hypothetical protein